MCVWYAIYRRGQSHTHTHTHTHIYMLNLLCLVSSNVISSYFRFVLWYRKSICKLVDNEGVGQCWRSVNRIVYCIFSMAQFVCVCVCVCVCVFTRIMGRSDLTLSVSSPTLISQLTTLGGVFSPEDGWPSKTALPPHCTAALRYRHSVSMVWEWLPSLRKLYLLHTAVLWLS